MFHCLNEILELCLSFCSLVSQNVAPLDERGAAQLELLVKVRTLRCITQQIIIIIIIIITVMENALPR